MPTVLAQPLLGATASAESGPNVGIVFVLIAVAFLAAGGMYYLSRGRGPSRPADSSRDSSPENEEN